ncbi:MAG TPA: ABC transporter ATP-binding protein [Amnibacterium sp.]|jgi:ABC-2 type transport system ATP-binding protein|nr:ABC transporter ATP-binding protein [Amnibacterium sp.]
MMKSAVDVAGLVVHRGRNDVLRTVSASVPTGAVVGLLGPSGSGKTTLMRAVVGVQRITAGTVTVLGRAAGHPQLRSRIGYVSQSPSVYDDLTIRQNLAYFGRIVGAPAGDVDRVLDEVDLREQQHSLVRDLSGGQQSRVSLGAALLGHPELLVLDEPTVGLDPVLRRDLWSLFRSLAARGTTLLVSSHVMDEAQRCDRILLLRDGALLADVTPAELLERTGTTDADDAFLALVGAAA